MSYEAIKVKLDPTPRQMRVLNSHFGAARFVWNFMLNYIEENYANGIENDYSKYGIRNTWNKLKHIHVPWYKENYKDCYAEACFDLAQAWKNFFDGCKGKRADKPGKPNFKKRSSTSSFRVPWQVDITGCNIQLPPKFGVMHCFENVEKRLKGRKPKYLTFSFDGLSYYVSLLVEVTHPKYNSHEVDFIGIDVGLSNLATLSDGSLIENNHHLQKSEKKLCKYQRMMSHKQGARKGEKKSNRFKKAQKRVNKQHKKVKNQRRDMIEKVTTDTCKTYKNIAVEDLKVKNMVKNRRLAKSLHDASLAMFRSCLERKADKYGDVIYKIDTFYPSSKTCSQCGSVKAKLGLNERVYKCECCGLEIDRDLNAAKNLEAVARRTQETLNGHGERVRLITLGVIEQCSVKCQSGNQVRPEVLAGNGQVA